MRPHVEPLAGDDSVNHRDGKAPSLLPDELRSYLKAKLTRFGAMPSWQLDDSRSCLEAGLSVAAIQQFLSEIRAEFCTATPSADLVSGLTIERLVDLVVELLSRAPDPAAGQTERAPLSHGQRALWFLHRLAPQSSAYNIARALLIRSPDLDPAMLTRSMQALIDRHAALRTRYVLEPAGAVQLIDSHQDADFRLIDARGWPEAELREQVRQECALPFDLERGPVVRVRLFQRGASEYILATSGHHIALDMWSLLILGQEMGILFAQQRYGIPMTLPRPQAEYTDFVRWHDAWVSGDEGNRAWQYWKKQLSGDLPLLSLPYDRPRPPVLSYRGATHAFRVEAGLWVRLKSVAAEEAATPYMIMLAAYYTLLHRYTGQEDILVASPASGRSRSEFEKIVGYFVNLVLIRASLTGDLSFRMLLRQVRDTVRGALDHQDFPFALLVERLRPTRDISRDPFLQAAFMLQRPRGFEHDSFAPLMLDEEAGAEIRVGTLSMKPIRLDLGATPAELTMALLDTGDQLAGSLQYSTDLFDESTAVRMAQAYQQLLAGIAADPDLPISRFPLLSAEERRKILYEWNDTAEPWRDDACVHHLFEAQVQRTPDAVALSFEGYNVTYAELDKRANGVAHTLRELGLTRGAKAAICLDRSVGMVVGLLGILKCGAAYVPLDPAAPRERLAFMLQDSRAHAVISMTCQRATLPAVTAPILFLDEPAAVIPSDNSPVSAVSPADPVYVIYTSGSTGQPKGTVALHSGVVNHLRWRQKTFALTPMDRVLQKTPFTFDVSVWELFLPLSVGARLVMAAPGGHQDPAYLRSVIQQEKITVVHFVPSMLALFLDEEDLSGCESLQRVMCGGESLTYDLQRRFFERLPLDLNLCYGPTETTIAVTYLRCTRENLRPGVRIGRPIANTQVYVLDSRLEPVPIGVVGEIYIGGHSVGAGYVGDPKLTAERFLHDPFAKTDGGRIYRTGDLGRYASDGCIEFVGRRDTQVKIRGFRVELGEIEAALRSHVSVRDAVVRMYEHQPGDQRLAAYVVLADRSAAGPAELKRHLEQSLPAYMVPAIVMILDQLPLGATGKIDRKALPKPESTEASEVIVEPRDDLERRIADAWKEILGVETISVTQDFFLLGGHSLLAVRLMNRLQKQSQREIPVSVLFHAPTIERLAAWLRAAPLHAASAGVLIPIRRGGSRPPLFCVHPSGGNVLCYQELATFLDREQSLFAFEAVGLRAGVTPHRSIEEMAAYYIQAMRSELEEGPYLIAGWSLGGVVAFEMAHQLVQSGEPRVHAILIDAPVPSSLEGEEPDLLDALVGIQDGLDKDRRLADVARAGSRALRHYTPPPATFPATVFYAEEPGSFDTVAGWRERGVQMPPVRVPGGHHTLLMSPNVDELAARLSQTLEMASRQLDSARLIQTGS